MESRDQEIEVVLDSGSSVQKTTASDPFMVKAEEFFKLYSGSMDKNALCRAKYMVSKFSNGITSDGYNSSGTSPYDGYSNDGRIAPTYQRGQQGAGTKQLYPIVSAYDILQATIPPHDILGLANLYAKSSWNYAAINAKMANIIGLGYSLELSPRMANKLQKVTDTDKLLKARNLIDSKRLDLYDWIESLNSSFSLLETLTHAFIDYQATGNGYLEIGRITSGPKKGTIGYIGHIPTSTIRVRRFHDGYVQLVQGRIRFFRNYGDQSIEDPLGLDSFPNEIIHLKKYNPVDTFYGMPDILAAMNAVAGDEFAQRYNLDLFEHKAAPRYVVIAKGANLSPTSTSHILEFLQSGLKGKNHRSIYIPLPPDREGQKSEVTFNAVETGIQDSSFSDYRKANRDEILAVHRVPATKIGIIDAAGAAASIDQDKTFKEVVCRPEQDHLEHKLNKVLLEVQDVFVLKFNELTLTDAAAQAAVDEKYLRLKTVTPNEVRTKSLSLPPHPDGDTMVELKPQQAADTKANALKSRTRDSVRANNASAKGESARNPAGAGPKPEK